MSGLHTRGYRPAQGERGRGCGKTTRHAFRVFWRQARRGCVMGTNDMAPLALRCLDARSLPEWLTLSPETRAMIRAFRSRVRRRSASEVS